MSEYVVSNTTLGCATRARASHLLQLMIILLVGTAGCVVAEVQREPRGVFRGPGSQPIAAPTGDTALQPREAPAMAAAPTTQGSPAPVLTVSNHGPNAALDGLPRGEAQRLALCDRAQQEDRDDPVVDGFCGAQAPQIASLRDLLKLLNVDPQSNNPAYALNAHTASLSVRDTSALNPRAVLINGLNTDSPIAVAYTRGEQAAEIVVRDRVSQNLAFYFAAYEQPCNADRSCGLAELFAPRTETGWTQVSIYPNEDFENTILDCNTCHLVSDEDAAAEPRKILRMQELQNPWTHWMRAQSQGGAALIADFQAAHGEDEEYAGIPGDSIAVTQPPVLQAFVSFLGFATQPNEFNTRVIEFQVASSAPDQPENNDMPGTSEVWEAQYERSLKGEALASPYHDVKVTDSAKLKQMTAEYKAFQAGTSSTFPDFRAVFREDRLHEMAGMRVDPRLTGHEIITAACTQCHNSMLNQSLSRARFNVDFAKFSDNAGGVLASFERDQELARAIERIRLPASDIRRMPPERLRDLTAVQVDDLTRYLCSQMSMTTNECSTMIGEIRN